MKVFHISFVLLICIFFTTQSITAQSVTGADRVCSNVYGNYSISGDISWTNRITWSISGGSFTGTTLNKTTVSAKFTTAGTVSANLYVNNEPGSTPPYLLIQTITLNVSLKAVGTIITSATYVCLGTITLSNNGGIGDSFSWQSSPAGQNAWSTFGTNSGGNVSPSISQSTDYRLVLNDCGGTLISPTKTVNINPSLSSAGSISNNATICSGSSPASLQNTADPQPSGYYSMQWQQKSGGGAWADITGATGSAYSPSALTQTTIFRRVAKWSCNAEQQLSSNEVTVDVTSPSATGSVTASASAVCSSGNINISAGTLVSTSTQWQYRYSDNGGSTFSGWSNFSTANSSPQTLAVSSGSADRIYQVQVIAQNGICGAVTSGVASITVNSNNGGIVTPLSVEAYGVASGNLVASAYTGTFQKWVKSNDSGATWPDADGTNSQPSYNYTNITSNVRYKALISNGACANTSPVVIITISTVPSIAVAGNVPPTLSLGNSLTLQSVNSHYTYQWIKGGADIPGATSSSLLVTEPGQYQLRIKSSATAPPAITGNFIVSALGYEQDNTTNMLVTTVIRKPGVTSSTNLYTLQPSDYIQSITYSDDLGRPTQSVAIGASPLMKDIVQPYSYDSVSTINYLPYVANLKNGSKKTTALSSGGSYTNSDQYLFYQSASKVAHSTAPYAKAWIENSPLGRIKEQGAPGTDWQPGGGHTIKPEWQTNSANNVRIWTPAGPVGYYAANTLAVNKIQDENGNNVYTFTDKAGQLILKRIQLDATVNLNGTNVSTSFLETYSVYDKRGNLTLQIPPKAIAMLNSGTAWTTSFRNEWCYVYTYDSRNRLVEKKTPDVAWLYYGYDIMDRLVLTQDGNLRAQNQWAFVKYDLQGRPVITGIYTNSSYTTRTSLQANVLDLQYASDSDPYYEQRGTALHGYTNQSFPVSNSPAGAVKVLSVSYYDDYDFDTSGADDYTYTSRGLLNEGTQGSSFGLPTGSKKAILGTATMLYTYQFYDRQGRLIQTRSSNHLSAAVDNLVTVVYDFEGKVLLTKNEHNAGGSNQTATVTSTSYDPSGRPVNVYSSINNAPAQLLANYSYNELGQQVEKNLHSLPGGGFLQSVDYRYHIRGWLSSINNAQLSNDGSINDDLNDYFGMELVYNQTDAALGNSASFNGNLSAIKWKGTGAGSGTADQRSYKFSYDKSDKLITAAYQKYGSTAWNQEVNTLNETQSYDHNGNLLTLQRNRIRRGLGAGFALTTTSEMLDNLTYSYTSGKGNQLTKVEDAAITDGFNNGANVTTEYSYSEDGAMTSDQNKGISSITYNVLGKPQQITLNGSPAKTVTYVYNAAGTKLSMVVYDGTTTTTTDYVDGFVYENGALSFFASPEGRVVKNGSGFEYQYAITDHQGNTRVVFSSQLPPATTYSATLEDNTLTNEVNTFASSYPSGAARSSLELFDHTDFSGPTYSHSQLLNGGNNSQIGLAKTLKVYPGDVIHAEVYAKYWNETSNAGNVSAFAGALTSAFGLSPSSVGEALKAYSALNSYGGVVALAGGSGSASAPKAFITVLLFDKNFNFVDAAIDQIDAAAQQNGVTPKAAFDLLSRDVTVTEPGYAYIYISNENPTQVDVYFDDLSIVHTKTNVVQYNEYYPFGLQNQNSWTRENTTGNNFLYNEGNELNTLTGLYDTFFRGYDPVLGRFHQVDPLAHLAPAINPYQYAFNSPVMLNDPTGAYPNTREGDWWGYMRAGRFVYPEKDGPGGGLAIGSWAEDVFERAKGGDPYAIYQYAQMYGSSVGSGDLGTVLRSLQSGDVNHTGSGFIFNEAYGEYNTSGSFKNVVFRSAFVQTQEVTDQWDTTKAALGIAVLTSAADGPIPVGEAVGAVIVTGAVAYDIAKNFEQFYYVTYIKINKAGRVYVGRSSGYGDPVSVVIARDRDHDMTKLGFGKAVLTSFAPAQVLGGYATRFVDPAYWFIR